MKTLIGALVFISLGFIAGWYYGYKKVTEDVERIVKHVIGRRG